jgi:hypothetical protein
MLKKLIGDKIVANLTRQLTKHTMAWIVQNYRTIHPSQIILKQGNQ